ncbi:MAG: 30S ribosomal protein S6 [Desulfocapsaceae bacterium]|nr:30S ribosomal protein S6 [Desulfocapsaceae bacterium]
MRRYEQIFILRPSLGEDEINQVIENSQQIIVNEAGTIISTDKWGMKKLAYPIKKELQGYYVFSDFAATPAAIAEVERKFRIDDSVLKYLSVKLADAITAEEIKTAQDEAEARAQSLQAESEDSDTETDEPVPVKKKDTEKSAVSDDSDDSDDSDGNNESEESEDKDKA